MLIRVCARMCVCMKTALVLLDIKTNEVSDLPPELGKLAALTKVIDIRIVCRCSVSRFHYVRVV